jgi:septal ring-binding cell division protein DamX
MISRTRQLANIALILLFITGTTACTTTSKKLTKTEPRVDNASQLAKAKEAYNQENYGQAAALLTPLAEQGDANAQYALGYLYHNGLGVPRNYKLAIQWMTAASAKGNEKATEALRRISELDSELTDNNLKDNQADSESPPMEPIVISGKKSDTVISPKAAAPSVSKNHETETIAKMEKKNDTESTGPVKSPEEIKTTEKQTVSDAKSTLSTDEKWIMSQPKTNYSIQLIATGNKSALMQFINENNLKNSAKYYKSQRNSKDWYTLIQGSYESHATARNAIKGLSPELQDLRPWIKSFEDIQKTLSNH